MTLNFHKSASPSMNMNDRSQIIKFFCKSLMAWIAFYSEVESTFLLSYIVFLLIYFLKKPRSECQRIATETWVDTKSNLGLTSAPSRDTPILLWFLFMLWKPRHAPAVCVLELCSGADSTWLYIVTVHFYKRSIIFCDYFSYKVWWLLMNCKVRLEKHFCNHF